jgi:hypothetical protein
MKTGGNIEVCVGQFFECIRAKRGLKYPIVGDPALNNLCLSGDGVERATGLKDEFFHSRTPLWTEMSTMLTLLHF